MGAYWLGIQMILAKHTSEQFIQNGNISPAISELFDSSINGLNDRRYHINETAFNNPESYKKILIHPQSKSSDGKARFKSESMLS